MQAGITDVKEAPQKPRKKNTASSLPNLGLPEVTQGRVPPHLHGVQLVSPRLLLSVPLFLLQLPLPSLSPSFSHPHSCSTMTTFVFYTCLLLLSLFHTPLFRFLREGERVGRGSPCRGRDFVLSLSYRLLTRVWPDAPIQPAVVGGAECFPAGSLDRR